MDPLSAGIAAGGNLLGGLFGGLFGKSNAKRQEKLQREFAQNGIQWKVADAKAAGIHPLAALGAQTVSYTPQAVGDFGIGSSIASAGQDIAAGIHNTRTAGQKVDAYTKTVQDLTLQRMGLENQILASQNAKLQQPALQTSMPEADQRWLVDGQGSTAQPAAVPSSNPLVSDKPLERTVSDPLAPHQEPGAVTDLGFGRSSSGYPVVPSADMKQRIEDDLFSELSWNLRNRVLPSLQTNYNPPFKAPEGKFWMYNPLKQEYQLYDKQKPSGGSWRDYLPVRR